MPSVQKSFRILCLEVTGVGLTPVVGRPRQTLDFIDFCGVPTGFPTLVQDGLVFIRAYALTGIKVPDVIRHLKVSRRLADLRFHEATGQSILQTIVETQMKEAKRLLQSTSLRISEIAFKCGYSNANYFKNVFSRTVGQSPRSWRKASVKR